MHRTTKLQAAYEARSMTPALPECRTILQNDCARAWRRAQSVNTLPQMTYQPCLHPHVGRGGSQAWSVPSLSPGPRLCFHSRSRLLTRSW
jgi:hypothetical protein